MLHPSPSEPCRAVHASPTTLRRAMPRPTTPVPCPDCHHPMLRHLLPGSRPSVKAAGLKCCGNSSLLPSHRSPKARGGGVCGVSRFFRIFFPDFVPGRSGFPADGLRRAATPAHRVPCFGVDRAGGSRGRDRLRAAEKQQRRHGVLRGLVNVDAVVVSVMVRGTEVARPTDRRRESGPRTVTACGCAPRNDPGPSPSVSVGSAATRPPRSARRA